MPSAFAKGRPHRLRATSSGLTIATTAYTSGDQLGAALSFQLGEPATDQGVAVAEVHHVIVTDKAAALGACELWLFQATAPTLAADNAAFSIADADLANLVGIFPCSDVYTTALNKVALWTSTSVPRPVTTNKTGVLHGALVTRSGHTFFGAVTDIDVTLVVVPKF